MAFNQGVCLQYFRFPTTEHASLQTYQRRLSVRPSVSLTCILQFDACLINALVSINVGLMRMHAFVAIIEDILSSHDKNQIHVQYTTTCACTLIVNVSVITEPSKRESKHVNPYTNTIKTHSLFKRYFLLVTFNSRERTHMCDMENFYAMPV